MSRPCFILFTLLVASGVNAEPSSDVINTNYHFESIRADDPNYFAVVKPIDDGAETKDDQHTEFYISLKYPLFKQMWFDDKWYMPNRFLFIYNGLYDFYMLPTYYDNLYGSSPIISRRQNPGFALEWDSKKAGQLRFGYFHESNGQSIDNVTNYVSALAAASNNSTYAIGQISRGWDYLTLRYEYDSDAAYGENKKDSLNRLRFHVDLRHFFDFQGFFASADKEDTVFWTTPVGNSKISEYDGLRLMLEGTHKLGENWSFIRNTELLGRVQTKTGISDLKALENLGGQITIAVKPAVRISRILSDEPWNFWISFFYFNGYGREPSSYHYRTEYMGIGLEMR
jgi:hypothetical protein